MADVHYPSQTFRRAHRTKQNAPSSPKASACNANSRTLLGEMRANGDVLAWNPCRAGTTASVQAPEEAGCMPCMPYTTSSGCTIKGKVGSRALTAMQHKPTWQYSTHAVESLLLLFQRYGDVNGSLSWCNHTAVQLSWSSVTDGHGSVQSVPDKCV
jgi:hypothetical protein